ncbi:hypothetical protein IFM89_018994 [Coptis chinensis]|uniref:Serine acetyltransferase N-terminal domain-containing protein n=1 Tax=Coptis chinensis TaxID=261450 RepID=A0A835I253_9MAGN|nr:hypothetical protein IFM89_018994 [Coptis chinensis]
MGCAREEDGNSSLPEMFSNGLVLVEEKKLESCGSSSVSKFVEFGLERVFPLYAMGNLEPDEKMGELESGKEADDPIWEAVRAEAKFEAEKEPILSSFLYASIMSHDCLERALAFVLANRLQNPILLATQLMDIFVDVMMHDRGIQRSIRLDAQAFKDRDPSCLAYCWVLLYLKETLLQFGERWSPQLNSRRKKLKMLIAGDDKSLEAYRGG